jgi:hypothetical protein
VDADRLVSVLDQFQFLGLLDYQLQQVLSSLVGRDLVPEDAPNELKLPDHLVAHTTRENWHRRFVLGQ